MNKRNLNNTRIGPAPWVVGLKIAVVLVIGAGAAIVATTGRAGDLDKPAVREPAPAGREPNDRGAKGATARNGATADDASSAISRLGAPPARTVVFTEEREAAARVFVEKNRPEMIEVLGQLKLSKPTEYRQVIGDLFRTSELFAAMRQEDRGRYEIALKTWRIEAKTHLLAAELAAHPERGDALKAELRATVEQLADAEIEQAAYAVKQWEAKLRRAEGQRKRIESGRGEFVNQRVDAILRVVDGLKEKRASEPQSAP